MAQEHVQRCVETADLPDGRRAVRDSKEPHGPALVFPADAWGAFVADVKDHTYPTP
ncbi:DUF397 domain-containing protein [Streptomyces sp. WAC05858]|uniref:DUF397 domain-containing protein n=1 Tax=Streptomyces TaxID=1883 RepID=UPI000F7732D1|nr:DUF397 domain-containing protein [Streptomyces sp. WAC05858]